MNDEKLCKRCGRCCKIKNKVNKKLYFEHKRHCRYLIFNKDKTTDCLVYYDESRKEHGCIDAIEGVKKGVMPIDCPYVKKYAKGKYKYNVITKNEVK